MNRRFVIAVEGLTVDQEEKFRKYVASIGAWWHWIANIWLLSDVDSSDLTVSDIREKIKEIGGTQIKALVMEIPEDITWATFGARNNAGKSMADWLKSTWARE